MKQHLNARAGMLHAVGNAVGISRKIGKRGARLALPLAATLVGWAHAPAAASDVDIHIDATSQPTFYVNTDGTHYTSLVADQPLRVEAELAIEAGNDRIRNWTVVPHMSVNGESWGFSLHTSRPPEDGWGAVHRSYGFGDRPSSVHRHLVMQIDPAFVDDFVVQACNNAATELRNQGASNAAIFGSEHVLQPQASFNYKVSYLNLGDIDNHPTESTGVPPLRPKIICMKWQGGQGMASGNLQAPVTVSQATLATIEKSTANGACKVILSGVIETNVTNAEVKFRYEHNNGKKSDLKTVKTDTTKTVMFSDEYDVPNNPDGDEVGMVRMVGENIAFQSDWSIYQMHCTAKAPGDLQAKTLPKLDMTVAAGKTEMVDGQICPSSILVQGLVTASSAFDGKALFLGDAFLTAPQPVSVAANQVKHLFANRALDWNTGTNFAGTLATSPGNPAALKSQKVRIGFNLANADGKLVGQVPQRWYTITCKKPTVNPGVAPSNDGMVSAPSGQ